MIFRFRNRPSHLDPAAVRKALDYTREAWSDLAPVDLPIDVEFTDELAARGSARWRPESEADLIRLRDHPAERMNLPPGVGPYNTPAHEAFHLIDFPLQGREEVQRQLREFSYLDRPAEERAWSWGRVADWDLQARDRGQPPLLDPREDLFPAAQAEYRYRLPREKALIDGSGGPPAYWWEMPPEQIDLFPPELESEFRMLEARRRRELQALQRALREGRF